jgi:multiple sugar transport system substrate-binding protein
MNRRWPVVGVVSALTALTLAACGSSGGGSGGNKNTLSMVAADYGTGPANTSQKYWQGIANDFHKANPDIKVNVKVVSWNDIDNQIKTAVQNKNLPDITEGNYYANYAQEGLLYKANDVLSKPDNQVQTFTKLGTYKGTQYGIPFTTSSRTLFYNKKLFQQAGISSAPQSWDDVKADALKIKALGKIGYGLPLGSEEAQAESLLWILGNGGNYTDSSGKFTINSSQNVETFQFLKDLVKSGATEPNPGTKNRTDLWKQFAQGDIGMINGSPALIPIIRDGKVLSDSDWTSVPIPGKSGPLSSTLGVCDFVAAFKNGGTKKQAAIKKFLDFAFQDKYQVQFDKEYSLLPATTSAVNALQSDQTFAPFLKALPNAVLYPIANPAWPNVLAKIQQTIGTAVTGDPKSVLSTIQQTAEKGS